VTSWRRAVPDWPRRRYNTFTGTNSWREWRTAWGDLIAPGRADPDAIRGFEAALARAAGCRQAFSFGAGRMGLYLLLQALDLKRGDEVILPGFTCVVVPNALAYLGVRPVFVDVDPVTFNMDPALVERAISPRTRAIYLQHSFGVSCRAEELKRLATRHGLRLIEDAAHSLGALHQGRPHGSWGDVSFFSTDRTKVINTHLGGAVATSDDALALRLAELQRQTPFPSATLVRRVLLSFLAEFFWYAPSRLWLGRPIVSVLRRLGLLFYWTDEPFVELPAGYPYPVRLSAAQARIGTSQLAGLPPNLAHRRRLAGWLEQRIGWYGAALPDPLEDQAWLRYSFLVEDRAEFDRRLRARFDVPFWFTSVLYGRERDLELLGYQPGSCPVAEKVARHIVNLPTHLRISPAALEELWSEHGVWIQGQVRRVAELPA